MIDIKRLIKEALAKIKRKYDYGCVLVNVLYDKEMWDDIQSKIDDKDIIEITKENNVGREDEPHITILYGLHSDVSDKDVEKLIENVKNIKFSIDGVSIFENEDFDVLKFDVKSKDLQKLNKLFKELPHTSKYPDYHPHLTITYLKAGKGKKYLKSFENFKDIDFDIDKIIYSKPNGKKKYFPL